jgi:hypothetical protein
MWNFFRSRLKGTAMVLIFRCNNLLTAQLEVIHVIGVNMGDQ